MVSVLTAGHINWDVTLRVDRLPAPDGEAAIRSQRQSGGGSAANVAVALSALEVDARLIGSVADDTNGVAARRDLEDAGIALDGVLEIAGGETAVKYLLVDDSGEVSVLGTDGVNEAVRPSDVDPAMIRAVDHVHLTSQDPTTAAYIASVASEAGVPVSFDPGRRIGDREYGETIALADIIFGTNREVQALTDNEALPAGCTVVIKYGPDGAEVRTEHATFSHPGFDVQSVDTTGAGDAFAAGFLESMLRGTSESPTGVAAESNGASDPAVLRRALERANACGALAASHHGPQPVPSQSTLEAFLGKRG